MGTIFCATDLSEAADEAIRQACDRARAEGAELVVFHAIESPPPYDPFFPHVRQGLGELRAREDEAAIAVAKRVTACTGLAVKSQDVVHENAPSG